LNGHYAAIGAPFSYGNFQVDYGPTLLYRTTAARLVLDRTVDSVGTSIDLSRRDLILGTNIFVHALYSIA